MGLFWTLAWLTVGVFITYVIGDISLQTLRDKWNREDA